MSRSIFGWSYPPGCSGPPEDVEVIQPKCKKCHSFLSLTPTRTEPWEASTQCDGKCDEDGLALCGYAGKDHPPHKEVWDNGVNQFVTCKRCKTENKI